MKRILAAALLFAVLTAAVCAVGADNVVFENEYYTLTLPSDWRIDLSDAGVDEDGEYEDLGFLYSREDDGLAIEAGLEYYENMKDVSLWDMSAEELEAHVEELLKVYEFDDAAYLDTVYAGAIPFVIIHCEDEDGEYYYAETVTNGYVVNFYAYALDWESNYLPLRAKHLDVFRSILKSFEPVTAEE